MRISEAVAKRIRQILKEKKMTQYRLEENSGVTHSTLSCIMKAKYKDNKLNTVVLLIRGLNMTVAEFFNDPIFESEDLDLE